MSVHDIKIDWFVKKMGARANILFMLNLLRQ